MKQNEKNMQSDMEWYCQKDKDRERFYEIFFSMCRKFNVHWASASEKDKAFVEEVTRVTYEREKAKNKGIPLSTVRPAFSDETANAAG